jgi:hypothetical protein
MLPMKPAAENGADHRVDWRDRRVWWEIDWTERAKKKPTISIITETYYIFTGLPGDCGTCGDRSLPYH